MFDWLMFRVANNYHGNPEIQRQCDIENDLVTDWAENALNDVSPKDYVKWREISDAYRAGYEAGKKVSANAK